MNGISSGHLIRKRCLVSIYILSLLLTLIGLWSLTGCRSEADSGWEEEMARIVWVAYSPPSADPNEDIEATPGAIREDLSVLREAGFTGLVTYGSAGIMGSQFPVLAEEAGFDGLIMGIWDPFNPEEIEAAEAASKRLIVLGYCVGNEGLDQRYEIDDLSEVIRDLQKSTGKPVTTTEQIDDYFDEELLNLGDWVFPNAHPFFHNQFDPQAAVQWTEAAYDDFVRRTDRFVMFKEVGLPTAGDDNGALSEINQDAYYQALEKTEVEFVYFEAFDQPWKTHLAVEPHWGIFYSDRTPKLIGWRLMGEEPQTAIADEQVESPTMEPETPLSPAADEESESGLEVDTPDERVEETPSEERPPTPLSMVEAFYIYSDADSRDNHYTPSGYMGDTGDIFVNVAYDGDAYSGDKSIQIVYTAQGLGPHECPYTPPCRWAGVYWQEPPNNWGLDEIWEGRGFDLTGYNRLLFWARAETAARIEFKVGGINQTYGDSLTSARGIKPLVTEDWQEFEIDLTGADLSHIIGGFVWATNWDTNPNGVTFYLDEIRFEAR